MTEEARMELLRKAVEQEGSQAAVAKKIGFHPSTINQVLKGVYGASTAAVLDKVEEVYSNRQVACPILGEISIGRCAEERRTKFSASNPLRVKLYRSCRRCEHNNAR